MQQGDGMEADSCSKLFVFRQSCCHCRAWWLKTWQNHSAAEGEKVYIQVEQERQMTVLVGSAVVASLLREFQLKQDLDSKLSKLVWYVLGTCGCW